MTTVVTGATGKVGKALVAELVKKGRPVRAVVRNASRITQVDGEGVEVVVGDITDPAALTRAFDGARAVFTVLAPDPAAPDIRANQRTISTAYAEAISASGVTHVVSLSSIGAHLEHGAGPISGLHEHEQRLNRIDGVHVLHLRPVFFMENFFGLLDLIRQAGILGLPLEPDRPFAMIATRDIARFAAERLDALDFTGTTVQELLGPTELTLRQATAILAKAIGRPEVTYTQFPYDQAQQGMVAAGISADMARLVVEMNRSFNEGLILPTQARSSRSTTPTTLETFGTRFAEVYTAAG